MKSKSKKGNTIRCERITKAAPMSEKSINPTIKEFDLLKPLLLTRNKRHLNEGLLKDL